MINLRKYIHFQKNFQRYCFLSFKMQHSQTEFSPVSESPNFPDEETKILEFWEKIQAFQTQLEKTKNLPLYTFYDGPPFATGLPHYGHICAGTIKDVVTRYATMKGHYVPRRFGWDCHGLPIENEIDKLFKIKTKEDVLKMGVANYNKECRSIVTRYCGEWKRYVTRLGRWIDFDSSYKTLDLSFMESVWYVFKQLWDKGLVYRGAKVMPYSTQCNTVLSNFEAGLNYQMVPDPSIYILFPLVSDPEVNFVAWTTTPWTLPSNLALAINPNFVYLKIEETKSKKKLIIAECRIKDLYKKPDEYTILSKVKGSEIVGIEYVPLFNYMINRKERGCFKTLAADFVTSDVGTGIVHCSPAYGDDDYKTCLKYGLITPGDPGITVDVNGIFTDVVPDYKGVYLKDADKSIIAAIKTNGRLLQQGTLNHSYPHCWRSNTPLIYRAIDSWFIKVTDIKENLIANNQKAYWVPKFAQVGRFHNWLKDAQDWCFSRNRWWGNPIPIWVSEDFEEQVCVGSIKELMELTGATNVTDLHKENIDHLTIPSKKGKGVLRRIDEVFDCWFESGAMPYASVHYPFSMSEEEFNKRFPADFIGEGLDQTRGWFYTLNVIGTGFKNDTPYKNLIVNGIVLAKDGSKMSKSKKNFPDPMKVVDSFGADAIRLYLMNSGLVRGEAMRFNEDGVHEVVKDVFLPWYNCYRFLIQNITRWEKQHNKQFIFDEKIFEKKENFSNIMDLWIIASCNDLIKHVRNELEAYKLYTVVPMKLKFLKNLSNWYLRLNRSRLKGETGDDEWAISLNILFYVMLNSSILMSPYVPFISELFYQNLRKVLPAPSKYLENSIHFLRIPDYQANLIDESLEKTIDIMQRAIELARTIRDKKKISLKQPIMSVTIIAEQQLLEDFKKVESYIMDEINCAQVFYKAELEKFIVRSHKPDFSKMKEKYEKDELQKVAKIVTNLKVDQVLEVIKKQILATEGYEIVPDDIIIKNTFKSEGLKANEEIAGDNDYAILVDLSQDENLKKLGFVREFVNRIQRLRKEGKCNPDDPLVILYHFEKKSEISDTIEDKKDVAMKSVKKSILPLKEHHKCLPEVVRTETDIDNHKLSLRICKEGYTISEATLEAHKDVANLLSASIGSFSSSYIQAIYKDNTPLKLNINNKEITLNPHVDFKLVGSQPILKE